MKKETNKCLLWFVVCTIAIIIEWLIVEAMSK
ncbi:MAG: sarcolipin [Podoviridae sp. ctQNx1]|nr:MAG: sarcolipin [Podoviridae sp. ctQNx1]UOF78148.1 sercA1a [Caudoviricetes sp.]